MTDTWKKRDEVLARVSGRLAPVSFIVRVDGTLPVALYIEAMKNDNKPETIITEALRAYLGDA